MCPHNDPPIQIERTTLALHAINDGIWDWELGSSDIYFSPRWKKMLDYSDHEVGNSFLSWQELIHPDDFNNWLGTLIDFLESALTRFELEYRLRAKDGSWRWIKCQGVTERDGNELPLRLAGSHTDISQIKQYEQYLHEHQREHENIIHLRTLELKHANEELRHIASRDFLTGVWNRRAFEESMAREWSRARRHMGIVSVIMVDIDHFKQINDLFGHLAGDTCLVQIAKSLCSQLNRITDNVYRYGGEEFAILLPDTRLDGALDIAERMREQIVQISLPPEITQHITISLGVGTAAPNPNCENWHSLIATADSALYHAKKTGRNRVAATAWRNDMAKMENTERFGEDV